MGRADGCNKSGKSKENDETVQVDESVVDERTTENPDDIEKNLDSDEEENKDAGTQADR